MPISFATALLHVALLLVNSAISVPNLSANIRSDVVDTARSAVATAQSVLQVNAKSQTAAAAATPANGWATYAPYTIVAGSAPNEARNRDVINH
jgi:hypothetical protein